jgi:hypothetical protein
LLVLFEGLEAIKTPDKVIPIQSIVIKFKLDMGYESIFLFETRIAESEINEIFELLKRTDFVSQHGLTTKIRDVSVQSVQVGNQIEKIISILSAGSTQL